MPGKGYSQLRKGRFSEAGRIYLLTTVTNERRKVFEDFLAGRILVNELMAEESRGELRSLAYVIMPDHLHWLVQLESDACMSICTQRAKSLSARAVNAYLRRLGRFWQDGFHDHAVRTDQDLVNFARYVVANPLRAGLVRSLRDYPLWDAIWL